MNRRNILWLIGIITALLLAFQVMVSTHITSLSPADWGLLLRLPLTFWIGLSILSVLLFFGRKCEWQTIIVSIIIFIFLFAIPIFVLENKAEWISISYFRASQADFIISNGHLAFNEIQPWELLNWPGSYFIAALLSVVTGLSTTTLADFFPLLTMALVGVIAYSLLKLKLNNIFSCLGALLVVASFYTGQEYFSPQAIAYVFFVAVILLSARLFFTQSRNAALSISVLIIFTATVTTHLLTSFVIFASIIVIYIFKKIFLKKSKPISSFYSLIICILFTLIFFLYQSAVINQTFIEITSSLYNQLIGGDTHLTSLVGISKNRVIGSTAYNLEIFGTYTLTIVALFIAAISILFVLIGLLRHKKESKLDLFWVAWIIVAVVMGMSISYGGEGIIRAFMFLLLPTVYFAVKYLSKKPKILVVILIVVIFIHFPAAYTRENYLYVPSSELKGASALMQFTPLNASIFNEDVGPKTFSIYNDRDFQNIQHIVGFYSVPSSEIINDAVNGTTFVVFSDLQNNMYQYFLGVNLLENISLTDKNYDRLYDSNNFQIYSKVP